jgi:uncharacterized membrane protein
VTKTDVRINSDHAGGTAVALGVASATVFLVGWSWDHRYVPLLVALAPIAAVAGLVFAAIALYRNQRAAAPALIGGLSLLVLLGYAYALLAYGGAGN